MKDKTVERWLPIQSIAETLGCTDKYVYLLIHQGALRAIKLGERALRVSDRSLQAFIAARVVHPEDYFAPEEPPDPEPLKPHVARSLWMNW